MKKFIFASCLALVGLTTSTNAQTTSNDPIVMRIAGIDVPRSEFEYNFNKNNSDDVLDKKSQDEYVDMFINYKLKVKAAEDAHLDTLSSFQKEFRTYRDQQIRPLLVADDAEEKEVRKYYDGMLAQLKGHDLRMAAHIFVRLPQKATPEQQTTAKNRVDSIYQALQQGASYEQLAQTCSDDKATGMRGGLIPQWLGPGSVLKEMEDAIYSLNDSGQVTKPILTSVGYHIIQLRAKKNLEPYEELKPQIQNYLQSQGLRDKLAMQAVDSLAKLNNLTTDQLLDAETERLCAKDDELKYLVKEYHDGLLLYEICSKQVWEPAAKDTAALQRYFKTNQKKYAYDKPHFRGMVFYCKNKADVKVVQKMLKKVSPDKWIETIRTSLNKDSIMVRMERRIFAQGDNAFVDSLALKQKNVKAKAKKDYPYAGVIGKVLKKGAEEWTDVSSQVVTDYQAECDKAFVEELRKRYEVITYPDALATVNKH